MSVKEYFNGVKTTIYQSVFTRRMLYNLFVLVMLTCFASNAEGSFSGEVFRLVAEGNCRYMCILKYLLSLLHLKLRYIWQLNDWFLGSYATDVWLVLNFTVISSEKGTVIEHIITHACILSHARKNAQNGYGLLFPAGCWVEVAELAAACWCLVTRSPSSASPYRWVNESNFIKSRGCVMFQKFEFQCSRETFHVLARDQSLLCVGW